MTIFYGPNIGWATFICLKQQSKSLWKSKFWLFYKKIYDKKEYKLKLLDNF